MRISSRAWFFALLASDSITRPVMTAFLGITVPLNRVAAASFAWILVPTGVFPVSTFCCKITGNSCKTGEEEAGGVCCPIEAADQKPSIAPCTTNLRVNIHLRLSPSDLTGMHSREWEVRVCTIARQKYTRRPSDSDSQMLVVNKSYLITRGAKHGEAPDALLSLHFRSSLYRYTEVGNNNQQAILWQGAGCILRSHEPFWVALLSPPFVVVSVTTQLPGPTTAAALDREGNIGR